MNQATDWRLVKIGLIFALVLLIAALAILGITSRQKLFERKVEYYSIFPSAAGLKEGSGVWYQGVEVGYVSSIAFSKDVNNPKVVVKYRVSSQLVPRIRSSTRASIKTLGLLGDKYLALITPPGTMSKAPNIVPGHEIPIDQTLNLEALGRGAQDVMDNIIQISRDLNELLNNINNGGGVISRLLKDPEMGQETVNRLSSISKSLDKISATIANGQGFAGKMLADPAYGNRAAQNLSESLEKINAILTTIQKGKGGAGAFVAENGQGEEIVKNLAVAAQGFAKVADGLQKKGTLANDLFVNEEYGKKLGANLLSISDSLASILKKVDNGQGTVGALINDKSVYNSLSAVADGIQRSSIVKWYLEKKAKDAARAAKRESRKESQHQK